MSNIDPTQQFPAPQGQPVQQQPLYYGSQPPPPPAPAPAPKKKMSKGKKWLIGIGAFVGLGIINGIVNPTPPQKDTLTTVADSTPSTSSARPTVDPSVQAARDKAAADAQAAAAKKAAAEEAKKRAAEAAAAKKAADDAARAEAAKKDKGSYEKVSAREFKKICKDADSYKGKKYVVYGVVSQFDSATGEDTFRANADSSPHDYSYEYNENAIVTTDDTSMLKDVVQDDFVTMYVEVMGSMSYDTQIGGNTTAPQFKVNMIKVTS